MSRKAYWDDITCKPSTGVRRCLPTPSTIKPYRLCSPWTSSGWIDFLRPITPHSQNELVYILIMYRVLLIISLDMILLIYLPTHVTKKSTRAAIVLSAAIVDSYCSTELRTKQLPYWMGSQASGRKLILLPSSARK